MTRSDALRELFAHLEAESRLLESLVDLLEDEGKALRALDLDGLSGLAARKMTLVDSQVWIARQRAEKLAAFGDEAPTTLAALQTTLDDEDATTLVALRRDMREAAAQAAELNAKNELFAQSGFQLVSGVLRIVARGQAGSATTYAADGSHRGGGSYGQTRRRL